MGVQGIGASSTNRYNQFDDDFMDIQQFPNDDPFADDFQNSENFNVMDDKKRRSPSAGRISPSNGGISGNNVAMGFAVAHQPQRRGVRRPD